jgi:hypothetical protein
MPDSILAGADAVVARALGIEGIGSAPHQHHRASCVEVCKRAAGCDFEALLRELVKVVESNWNRRPAASVKLWDLRCATGIDPDHPSIEKQVEKAIVRSVPEWFNQIAAGSGLADSSRDRHRNVDLAHRVENGVYELFEFKIGRSADTPLRAAIELLEYCALYTFARLRHTELGLFPASRPLLRARSIRLGVLATGEVYSGWDLGALEQAIDLGVRRYARQDLRQAWALSFGFESLPADFSWPLEGGQRLTDVLKRKQPLHGVLAGA